VGLLHTPGNPIDHLMREDISLQARWIDGNGNNMFDAGEGKTFRMIEADSAFGAAELYTVVPEPTSVLSIALAALALVKRRRRA
jgi:PEP-CTERM motif-containing protein